MSESYYGVWFIGTYILFACLTIFGIIALTAKPLPHWNALPLLSGLWFTNHPSAIVWDRKGLGRGILIISIAGFIVMAVTQVMLGYIPQADASQEMATT
jgi:hypothetical protein